MKKFYLSSLVFLIAMMFSTSGFSQVDIYNDLYSESGNGSIYKNTAYNIYTSNIDDLASVVVSDSADFINIYELANNGTNQSYSLHGIAGKSLKAIFEGDNNENQHVDIAKLRHDYLEWFRHADGSYSLIVCNVVARMVDAVDVNPIEITTDLISSNAYGTQYENTAYFVKGIATEDDLDTVTVANDIDWLNIYVKSDSSRYERIDVDSVAGKTLKTIFNDEGITINDLYFGYKEWFEKDGSAKLIRLNLKAVKITGNRKVIVTTDLYSSSQVNQQVYSWTAYNVLDGATLDTLANYPILVAEVDFVNIYYKDGLQNKRIEVPITGDTDLKAVLEQSGVDINDLRDHYLEWFYQKNQDSSYTMKVVKLNMKAGKFINSVPTMVIVRDSLYTVGTSEDYAVKAFLVNPHATDSALSSYTLNGDAGTNIYYTHNGIDLTKNVSGTNGQTLLEVLNNAGISRDSLRNDYWEWFYDENGNYKLINLNIKQKSVFQGTKKVVITKGLLSHKGDTTFNHTAYYVRKSAKIGDLDSVRIADDIEIVKVYTKDPTTGDPVVHVITNAAGKTLREILDENSINFDDLMLYYIELFEQDNLSKGNYVWVRLNFDAYKEVQIPSVPLSNWALMFGVMLISLFSYVNFRKF
jgi:hypothetical protein